MVDLEGFREVVDALGGITVNVKERLSYGAIKASGAIGRSQGFIEPGLQQMDGETALLYARSRDFATDYDRMARQRCVVNAIVDTADPVTVFRSYPQIAGTLREHLQTDIPAALLPAFVDLGDRIKAGTQTSVAFVPPLITSANPDFALIRQTVTQALIPVPPEVPAAEESTPTPAIPTAPASRPRPSHRHRKPYRGSRRTSIPSVRSPTERARAAVCSGDRCLVVRPLHSAAPSVTNVGRCRSR